MHSQSLVDHDADAALLDMLTGPTPPKFKKVVPRRDEALDPLLLAAAAASGPHVTRNHYQHDFYPVMDPKAEDAWDWTKWKGENAGQQPAKRLTYVSKQAPRRMRLGIPAGDKENSTQPFKSSGNLPPSPVRKRRSFLDHSAHDTEKKPAFSATAADTTVDAVESVIVKCMARTRIPTPHGPAFLHLYHNNKDAKEHLAIVIDPAQYATGSGRGHAPHIRSRTLDAVWGDSETEMDRITRGAYVGKLSGSSRVASIPVSEAEPTRIAPDAVPSPLVRIHSECFTGETVGSMRCDCGEQLDEALRLISQPISIPSLAASTPPVTIPGRGAVIYLRQEGRGIGLLSKIRAYNLQDLGYDTVAANLMLGHQADERGYEIAGAILRDLGLGGAAARGEDVRLLTNNPDKVQALEQEGVRVVERVPMIPRSWQSRSHHMLESHDPVKSHVGLPQFDSHKVAEDRHAGATMIGGGAVHGADLDKYLRTKVTKMGHFLPLWLEDPEA